MLPQYRIGAGELTGQAVPSPFYHPEAEWPLIIFTVSLQSAVGTMLWSLFRSDPGRLPLENLLVILGFGVIGMLGAMGHLASPLRAPRAVLNWRSSWLSREIFLSSAFLGLVVLTGAGSLAALLTDGDITLSPLTSGLLAILTGLAGLALVGAMSMIYLVPTRPVWNHHDTLASFYTGALQLGWAISAAVSAGQVPLLKAEAVVLWAAGLILLTLLRLKVVYAVIDRLGCLEFYRQQEWGWLNGTVRQTRIALALAGGVVLPLAAAIMTYLHRSDPGTVLMWVWIVAAVLLIIGEGMDRWVFFRASPAVIFPPHF